MSIHAPLPDPRACVRAPGVRRALRPAGPHPLSAKEDGGSDSVPSLPSASFRPPAIVPEANPASGLPAAASPPACPDVPATDDKAVLPGELRLMMLGEIESALQAEDVAAVCLHVRLATIYARQLAALAGDGGDGIGAAAAPVSAA